MSKVTPSEVVRVVDEEAMADEGDLLPHRKASQVHEVFLGQGRLFRRKHL